METDSRNVILLIADISGYTRFLRLHALANSHARQIVARLLRALVDTSQAPLKLAEVEGDAVFFYADASGRNAADQVQSQILRFYRVFEREIEALEKVTACACEACANVGQLKLKQVMHTGDVSIERIGQFEKLLGLDVILVHRMLKNSVPAHDYLMMTERAFDTCADFFPTEPERRVEPLDGIGDTNMVVFYRNDLAPLLEQTSVSAPAPTVRDTIRWKLKMHGRTIKELLGLAPRAGEVKFAQRGIPAV